MLAQAEYQEHKRLTPNTTQQDAEQIQFNDLIETLMTYRMVRQLEQENKSNWERAKK